MTFKLISMW